MPSTHLRRTLWLMSLLLFTGITWGYDEYDQSSIFPEVVSVWQEFCATGLGEETFILTLNDFVQAGSVQPYQDTLEALAEQGLQSTIVKCRRESLKICCWFRTSAKQEYVRTLLDDPDMRETAAIILIRWGDWDLAAPILADCGQYDAIGMNHRAIPFLKAGVVSPDPNKRFSAALWLFYHGIEQYVFPVMREILAMDYDPAYLHLKTQAMQYLRKSGDPADLNLLADIAKMNPDPALRQHAYLMVLNSAQEGDPMALDLLFSISKNSIDMSVREQATQWYAELTK